ncbi:MAG: AMP-binding protein [Mycobacteriaceae bacterium]|nr:AMP-binding protein [Mycobacteriaceae bacterium]
MLSYDAGVTSPALLDETIGDNLAATAAAHADRDALVDCATGRRWTYGEFHEATRRIATALLERGITPGDRIGIWSPNNAEWTMVQYATAQVGAILVNINPAYRTEELEYALNTSSTCTVFAAPEFRNSDYVAMLESVRGRCPALADVVIFGWEPWLQIAETAPDDDALSRVRAVVKPSDPINIQYTSGTTGFPKGATLTHTNILNNGYFVGELLSYTEQDRVCIPVPFYHCFGMVMGNLACTTHGAAMVIPAPGFDPEATLKAVAAQRCTSLYGVPTMFIAELGLPNFDSFDLRTLRTGIMAGSPCPEHVMRSVIDRMHMAGVAICYGMTETSPVSTQTLPSDSLTRRVTTVGRVGPHLEVQVVDDMGEPVERGTPGELCTRGYSVMRGYWEDAEKTAEAIDEDGWMHTGDIAVMDDNGYLAITGRIKDMVIRGGENIYPREIEEFLYSHPDIVDAQVVGVSDEKYGEELMVWLRVREGAEPPTPESLRAFCAGRIAHHKIPRYVQIIDDFPMTVTGKVRKVELRERGEALLE